jgi:acyl-CoA synthetase (AMP-forming)/AMP-acid ligase II
MVSHGNLMTNTKVIQTAFEQPPGAIIVSWLPLFHDMGLIGTALDALTLGSHCVLMDPQSFIMKPVRWLRAISNYRAHTSGGPDFGYQLCTRKIKDSQLEGIDLSGWKVAFNGSERVRSQTVQDFARRFASVGVTPQTLYPCYGLAESTLFATGGDQSAAPLVESMDAAALEDSRGKPAGVDTDRRVDLVSCGRTWCGHQLLIVDPDTALPLADEQVGEIWLAGASVAKGYFNRPNETLETFGAHTNAGDGPYLRTGDLGFIQEGELFITGRLKDLIIVAGNNHHPEDIEQTVEACHPAIRPGGVAAFSLEEDGVERLGVVAELSVKVLRTLSSGPSSEMEIQTAIVAAATEAIAARHGLKLGKILLVRAGTVPKTTSGKVQRRRCKEAYVVGEIDPLGGPL